MKRNWFILIMAALTGLVLWAGPSWAGEITGQVKPQGLRSADNILVFVVQAPAAPVKKDYVMDQRNLTFIPHVLPVPVGATVDFPNNDKVDHNVFSLSSAKKFNLGSYKPGHGVKVTFDKPGVVELRCDVHQEMRAYILVMKNPYWALTDRQGGFRIPGPGLPPLPAGSYLVKTWHEKLRSAAATAQVPASGAAQVTLSPQRGPAGVLYKR
ncbi:MAG: methylamine utilization protein [Thermodesulfobacteriota bacterium]